MQMIIHNVRAISAGRALSDSRWGVYHCFITLPSQDICIHGYTDTFIKFLKKHPEIDHELSLIKDCVTKEDLQAQEEAPIMAEFIRDKI